MRESGRARLTKDTTDRIEELLRRLVVIQGKAGAMSYLASKIAEVSKGGFGMK